MPICLSAPLDLHLHFREGEMLKLVAPWTSRLFRVGLVMPNTTKPILTGEDAKAYKAEIKAAVPEFEPLMTIKLAKTTTPATIRAAHAAGVVAAKFYPEGATTNAEGGYASPSWYFPCFEVMQELGMILSLHGEVPTYTVMQRETAFLSKVLEIRDNFPRLKVILEHITTSDAASFVMDDKSGYLAATITAHHLSTTIDDVIGGKLNPHLFCKPIPKSPRDREMLLLAATSSDSRFFFGSDSAPHTRETKECAAGCAGVFSAPCALETVYQAFEAYMAGRIGGFKAESLNSFMAKAGFNFYDLHKTMERPKGEVELTREPWTVPEEIKLQRQDGEDICVVPFRAGETIPWKAVLRLR